MLNRIRGSLSAKIVTVVLLTTFAALSVATVALLVYEADRYREFLFADADTQAQILADITAPALAFQDPAGAQTNLELLSTRRELQAAAVYTADGKIFARYARDENALIPPVGPTGSTISGRTLTVFLPVVQDDEVLGTVFLQSRYELAGRIADYVMILVGVMMPSFALAALISLWLARGVTNPLRVATEVAQHVAARRDFARRAPRQSSDEVGEFVDAFNTMVAEVGERTAELEASNQALRQETDERRLAVEALRRSDQRKDEFLATLAHELRNPLAPMVTSMDLLKSGRLTPQQVTQAQDVISRQLRHMVRLVDDLLDVSRVTSGKLVLRKQAITLSQVIENAVETARPLLEARGHALTLELPAQPVHVHGDPVRLAQVFLNLLNNAAKFSEAGKAVAVRAAVEGQRVTIRVADEGIGIPPDIRANLFQMFVQGATPQGMTSGLGVGLSLARRLVELHDGTITVESEGPGHGSTFTVTLPTAPPGVGQRAAVVADVNGTGPPRRILVADDNIDFATTLSFLLKELGHEVRIAHNGIDALQVARAFRPELGFLDLGLPDISGYELAAALKSQADTAAIVLVAISGWGQQRDRERSREAGFAMHIVKPAEIRSIQDAITALLPHR